MEGTLSSPLLACSTPIILFTSTTGQRLIKFMVTWPSDMAASACVLKIWHRHHCHISTSPEPDTESIVMVAIAQTGIATAAFCTDVWSRCASAIVCCGSPFSLKQSCHSPNRHKSGLTLDSTLQEIAEELGQHRAKQYNVGKLGRDTGVRYEDVAGIEHVKQDITDTMEMLTSQNPEFEGMGARPPRVCYVRTTQHCHVPASPFP